MWNLWRYFWPVRHPREIPRHREIIYRWGFAGAAIWLLGALPIGAGSDVWLAVRTVLLVGGLAFTVASLGVALWTVIGAWPRS